MPFHALLLQVAIEPFKIKIRTLNESLLRGHPDEYARRVRKVRSAHAQSFLNRFGAELMDPPTRSGGRARPRGTTNFPQRSVSLTAASSIATTEFVEKASGKFFGLASVL